MIFAGGFILTTLAFFLTEVPFIAGQCSGSVKIINLMDGQSGSIRSPYYPSSYGRNEDCKWRIVAPSNQKILIYFITIDLEDCCNCDYVKIFDGRSSYSNILTKGCGDILPSPVYSSDKDLYMTFRSDESVQRNGFVAHYRALNISSGCPSIDPVATAGVIYSPNFPWNYPDNTSSCNWAITAPSWKKIKLSFIHFDLESSSSCEYDYVRVKYSQYYNGMKFCGTVIPSSITTYGSISVTFYSDDSISRSGFMAFYQTGDSFPTTASPYTTYPYYTLRPYTTYPYYTLRPYTTYPYYTRRSTMATPGPRYDACKPNSENRISVGSSSSSSIASPYNYNSYYSPSMICSWDIDTAEGYILQLTFDKMSISSCSGGCSCGNVKIYENVEGGKSSSNSLLGTYCSGHYPSTVTSKGNQMSVHYYGRYYDRFKATLTSKKAPTPTVDAAAVAVPIVIAVVLFAIIFAVIKCTKIRRSAEPVGSSITNEVPLRPFSHDTVFAPPFIEIAIPSSQPLSLNNTEDAPPPYQEPLPTASDPLPFSCDCSQGVTNIAISDETTQI